MTFPDLPGYLSAALVFAQADADKPAASGMQMILDFVNNSIYGLLAIDAVWGLYCGLMVFLRLRQKAFKNERQQDQFLDAIREPLSKGDFDTATGMTDGDLRAVPQLAHLACKMLRTEEPQKVQDSLLERFQRDVVFDLENRINWINNVIKTAPMLGLLGTVMGMMAAFGKLYASENVKPTELAGDISFALITTAIGLAITIPATLAIASINNRMKLLEDLVMSGLGRFMDYFAQAQEVASKRRK